jgi:amino acid adenylation domain-containing protein
MDYGHDRTLFKDALQKVGHSLPYPPITSTCATGPVELSYMQEQLWFLSQLGAANVAYNVPMAWRIRGALDVAALDRSLTDIVCRHESLRTSFHFVDGRPMQHVTEELSVHLTVLQLSEVSDAAREARAQQAIAQEIRRPFDLSAAPLFRALLLRKSTDEHILLLNVHHIVMDGTSAGLLIFELAASYDARRRGILPSLPPLPVRYRDFAAWEREWLRSEVLEKLIEFWDHELRGAAPQELCLDRARPSVQSFQGATLYYTLDESLTRQLEAISRREGVTLFTLMSAAFQTLIHRYSGQDDIVVGIPISNRNRVELSGLAGFFVNTVPLRADLSGDPTFQELLKRVRNALLRAYTNRDLPFQKLVERLDPERQSAQNPFFHVLIDQAQATWLRLNLSDLRTEFLPENNATAKFDLSLHCVFGDPKLHGWLEYSSDIYDGVTMAAMLEHFATLLQGAAARTDERISALPLITETQRSQLIERGRGAEAGYPKACIHELFELQTARTPDTLAIRDGQIELSYREVNRRANRLAHCLVKLGVKPEILIGVCLPHGWETLVVLLAILKAGGAYVPLDPAYPQDRLDFMLKDSDVRLVISGEQWANALPPHRAKVISLDTYRESTTDGGEEETNLLVPIGPENLAYVIYTSGSTGQPKGVLGLHRGAVNRFAWMWKAYPFGDDEVGCVKTSLNFVDSVWEIFGPLLAGVPTLVVPDEAVNKPHEFIQALSTHHVTRVVSVPSLLRTILDLEPDLRFKLPYLKYWISSGETLPPELARRFHQIFPDAVLLNLYGSSEVSADVTCYEMGSGSCLQSRPAQRIPIGRPIANTQIHILGANLEPLPDGVPGELYVGGASLARGYLNLPDETERQFIPNPFHPGRLYKTGDRARRLRDGNFEFLGRLDHQVKIRGARVELGEIESMLREHPDVDHAVACVREDNPGDPRLVAYVVRKAADGVAVEGGSEEILQHERLSHWKRVWDETYESSRECAPRSFNTSGWNSSYTGAAFTREEMQEWVDGAVVRILELKPRRVLEIGCGSGLLLSRIASQCERYWGTDFSSAILHELQPQIQAWGLHGRVDLEARAADDFAGFEPASFDTVVLNSVAQYFPSMDYLMRVLEGAVKVTSPGGAIFIGDVRDLRLLTAFHCSVELSRAAASTPVVHLLQQINKRVAEDPELVVDTGFFTPLQRRFPSISEVEVLPKRGRYANEMNRFRYDVILHLGSIATDDGKPASVLDWQADSLNLDTLRRILDNESPNEILVSGVPNARVTRDVQALKLVQNSNGQESVGDIRRALQQIPDAGVDPEILWDWESRYTPRVRLSRERDACCDVFFGCANRIDSWQLAVAHRNQHTAEQPWAKYANNPLRAALALSLVPELKRYLRQRLPDYMQPAAFVVLDCLPLTPNGKLDRRALPPPNNSRPSLEEAYVAPGTSVEQEIAAVWREFLCIDKVGTRDNFFDLGGHSLLLAAVHNKLAATFKQEISIIDLFQYPTIASLAKHFSGQEAEQRPLHYVEERVRKQKEALQRRRPSVIARVK